MNQTKLFPLRLPPNFHGNPKPFRRLSQINSQKAVQRENPEFTKISNWQQKRLDRDILRERREFLVHPAKISNDTPDWFKSTLHHFHRSNYTGLKPRFERSQGLNYTVLNQKRVNPFANTGGIDLERSSRIKRQQQVADKIGTRDTNYSTSRWATQKEVAGKIGSVERRDYSVPRPIIKIGHNHSNNFIDTYAIA